MIKIISSFLQNKITIYFLLFLVLVLSLTIFIQKDNMHKEMELKVQFIEQKNMLRNELDDILDEHESLLDEYGQLNEDLQEKDSLIKEKIIEIDNLINVKQDLQEAFKKIDILKSVSKRYIATIDSLLLLNERLANEKDSVININRDINWKNYKLSKVNAELEETVNKGSVLELERFEVSAIKKKITGKETTTKSAKKTKKINACFIVLGNSIAKAGTKEVYVQMIDQEGRVIPSNNFTFQSKNDTVQYTYITKFDYQNSTIEHCFEWERGDVLLPGYYLINLIIDNKIIIQTTLKLK
tara:strand:+ start:4203 stop:5096 length:894 start_codon:yes stop_codon:yes gene_type:complete